MRAADSSSLSHTLASSVRKSEVRTNPERSNGVPVMNVQKISPSFSDARGEIIDILKNSIVEYATLYNVQARLCAGQPLSQRDVSVCLHPGGTYARGLAIPGKSTKECVLVEGDLIVNEPLERHAFEALDDCTMLVLTRGPRGGDNYRENGHLSAQCTLIATKAWAPTMVPVSEPLIGDNVLPLVRECIESGWISSEGSFIQDFESKWARYCGAAHGVAVANGTCALQVAVRALALEPGAEIILPSFTIISCVLSIVEAGCVPVLVDVDPDTWMLISTRWRPRLPPALGRSCRCTCSVIRSICRA